jgi:hypothetical protein
LLIAKTEEMARLERIKMVEHELCFELAFWSFTMDLAYLISLYYSSLEMII